MVDFAAWYDCVRDHHNNAWSSRDDLDGSLSCPDGILPEKFIQEIDDDNIDDKNVEPFTCPESLRLKCGMKPIKRNKAKIIRSVRFNKENDPENYCREQLMLYTPWRNEVRDLIEDFPTYAERYEQSKSEIHPRRQQYEYYTDVLDKVLKDVQSEQELYIDSDIAA